MKRIKKANALVLTTIILFAVSIIASGLTMYFYYANIQNVNSSVYSEKHIELENEFNKNFEVLIKNEKFDASSPNMAHTIMSFQLNEYEIQTINGYKNTFICIDKDVSEVTFTYRIETSYKNKDYILEKTLVASGTSFITFSLNNKEVYKVNASR